MMQLTAPVNAGTAAGGRSLRIRSRWPVLVLTGLGCVLFVLSLSQPWWGMVMFAPQYPKGLELMATLQAVGGDAAEIDALNHYIGMMPISKAAPLERAIAPATVWMAAAAALAALAARGRLAWLLRVPMLVFPLFFLLDLKIWLWYAGNHLDPKAALSAAVKNFTPAMLGWGNVAQFKTYGWVETGFWLSLGGVLLVLAGGWLDHRRQQEEMEHG